jgi:hypothetical protein
MEENLGLYGFFSHLMVFFISLVYFYFRLTFYEIFQLYQKLEKVSYVKKSLRFKYKNDIEYLTKTLYKNYFIFNFLFPRKTKFLMKKMNNLYLP